MYRLSFIYPETLWLLLLLLPLWGVALAAPRRLSQVRFWGGLGVRSVLLLALVLSLAGTQLVSPVDALTTVFLIDSSDSMTPSARGRAETFVEEALDTMPDGDQAGLVVFGKNALVERVPGSSTLFGRLTSAPIASHTGIEGALQLGLALLPTATQKRLVLLSDGGENTGHAVTAAQLAATRNIPIDVVDLSGMVSGNEALISDLHAPTHARDGQEVELVVTIESNVAQNVRLHLFADEEVLIERTVHLEAGRSQFRYRTPVEGTGFRRYRAHITPEQDVRVQNNEAAALVQVQGQARVLLVEGQPGDSRLLADALTAAHIVADTVPPDGFPTDLTTLSTYESVVLVNVSAFELPQAAFTLLPVLVHDLGRGLVMVGGTRSYGVGGYGNTPIEDALPVSMEVRDTEERPNLAIVFVIDKSGSMDACHCTGDGGTTGQMQPDGTRKVDIAKEAAVQAAAMLGHQDILGIIAFDKTAHQILPATQAPATTEVVDAVAAMEPWGSTNVGAGLAAAEEMLAATDARIKHVVLLTDGWGEGELDLSHTAQRMHDNGITLSVVAAGSGSSTQLEGLARTGGGRYYPAEDMQDVPQIFLQETIFAAGHYLIEEAFYPTITTDSAILGGIDDIEQGIPALYGYNATTLKETARTVLMSSQGMPVLATWNYGLGRSVAWTSDMQGKWAHDWVLWGAFPRFAAQMVAWTFPVRTGEGITSDVTLDGSFMEIVATVEHEDDQPYEQLEVAATLIESTAAGGERSEPGEPGEPSEPGDQQAAYPLAQVAPGEYRTRVPAPAPGTYLVQLVGRDDSAVVAHKVVGMVVPYSPEYRPDQSNPALLDELVRLTGGELLSSPAQAFAHNLSSVSHAQEIALPLLLVVLVLLPFDIAIRRFVWPWPGLLPPRTTPPPAAPDPQDPSDPNDPLVRLRAAKERARRRTRGE